MSTDLNNLDLSGFQSPYGVGGRSDVLESASLLKEINPASIIVEFAHKLAGEDYDPELKKWVQIHDPLMNKNGISKVITIVSGVVNMNTILSRLDKKQVSLLIVSVGDEITELLVLKSDEFAIDPANWYTIKHAVCRLCLMALSRPLEQGERNFINKSFRVGENLAVRSQDNLDRNRSDPYGSLINMFKK